MLATLVLCLAAGDVHVVDAFDPTRFATLQDAIDVAASGDTILLRRCVPPEHPDSGGEIRGKGLTIIGLRRSAWRDGQETGPLSVLDLPDGESVVLRRLHAEGRLTMDTPVLSVASSAGAVRVENCSFTLQRAQLPSAPATVELDAALDVSFVQSEMHGTPAGALHLSRSRATLYETELRGARGDDAASYTTAQGGDGYPALDVAQRSFVWVGASTVTGGTGGWGECIHNVSCTSLGGDGGPGAVVEPGSLCVVLESEIRGGPGGVTWSSGDPATSMTGQPGPDVIGSTTDVPGAQRLLEAPSSIRSGEQVPLTFTGLPGEEVVVFAATGAGHRYLGPLLGVLLANTGFVVPPTSLGVVPSSGVLETTLDLGTVVPNEARTLQIQAIFRSAPSRFRTSPARQVSILGEGVLPIEPIARVYLDASAAPGGDGRTWATAANDLAFLLDVPTGGESVTEVWMREGVYPVADMSDPSPSAILYVDALQILGGFDGTETAAHQRDPETHRVTITGDIAGDDGTTGSRTDNADGLLHIQAIEGRQSVLSGLTFEGCENGTAVYLGRGSTVEDCRFEGNNAGSAGPAALVTILSSLECERSIVRRCEFIRNSGELGAGLLFRYNDFTFNCLPPDTAPLEVVDCLFVGNAASGTMNIPGGYAQRPSAIAIICRRRPVSVISSTFVDNFAVSSIPYPLTPSGVVFDQNGEGRFHNNVCSNSALVADPSRAFTFLQGAEASYNRVDVIPPGSGWLPSTIVTAPPAFVDPIGPDGVPATGDEDYRLLAQSPCIDAGDSDKVPIGVRLDLDGLWRFVDDPAVPNTGAGLFPFLDLGAYERQ